eukprot:TRINITY_DN4192_c0_g1_i2.p1 TRINITY_DN4192_c0_g1~~TRINITY_DN4192_c0_g1_i2.p1  ORF type:complete len:570 (-),score=169.12 TRINITY_DN4192_c0_g1_i2:1923-3632(-)
MPKRGKKSLSSSIEDEEVIMSQQTDKIEPAKFREIIVHPSEFTQEEEEEEFDYDPLFGFFKKLTEGGLDPMQMGPGELERVANSFGIPLELIKIKAREYMSQDSLQEELQEVHEHEDHEHVDEQQEQQGEHQGEHQVEHHEHQQGEDEQVEEEYGHVHLDQVELAHEGEGEGLPLVSDGSTPLVSDESTPKKKRGRKPKGDPLVTPEKKEGTPNRKGMYRDELDEIDTPTKEGEDPKRVPRRPRINPDTKQKIDVWLSENHTKPNVEKLYGLKERFPISELVLKYCITSYQDYDSPISSSPKKRYVFNDIERQFLKQSFEENPFPSWKEMSRMCFEKEIPYDPLSGWFKNQRAVAHVRSNSRQKWGEESKILEKFFETNGYPSTIELDELSQQTGHPAEKINGWFKRKRVHHKSFQGLEIPRLKNSPTPLAEGRTRGRPRKLKSLNNSVTLDNGESESQELNQEERDLLAIAHLKNSNDNSLLSSNKEPEAFIVDHDLIRHTKEQELNSGFEEEMNLEEHEIVNQTPKKRGSNKSNKGGSKKAKKISRSTNPSTPLSSETNLSPSNSKN